MDKVIKTKRFFTMIILIMVIITGCASGENTTNRIANESGNSDMVPTGELSITNPAQTSDPGITESVLPPSIINAKYYTITVSVNPEVELIVSPDSNEVLHVECHNEDASKLLSENNIDLSHKDYSNAVEEFVKACADNEFLNEENNDVNIIASTSHDSTIEVPDEYGEKMSSVVEEINSYVDFSVNISIPCPCCHETGLCTLCEGAKTLICEVCSGIGSWECEECKGTGSIPCITCGETGELVDEGVCDQCGGNATWECQTCGGSGKTSCGTCNGSGGCASCNNSGTQTCNQCGGSGCAMCGNSGLMECATCHGHNSSCTDCNGTGEQYCGSCLGTGTCSCNGCNGTGIYHHSGPCGDCDGTGKQHCNPCLGTGTSKCYGCNGEGEITCVRCDGDGLCPSCKGTKELGYNDNGE